ncbi:membrane protein, MarC family [Caulobacter sp. AP07]|uniref:MarC family protein n=1 Tax=Caulobacter sp. AP07 TaxID=1144304 RepID=UPI0002721B7C|nr:MarC family protein [Caulobacter sp. AP07]EJL27165.1 membrane protein, MarC family [Caulobacter sp. AP07]
MDINPLPVSTVVGAFLLAFPALFSIVNPVGSALIFHQMLSHHTAEVRRRLAPTIALYAFCILLGSLLLGGYILNFFGVSLGALRVAGGLVVAIRAWALLMSPEEHEDRKMGQASPALSRAEDIAFFPLTMPFTTGPGAISVAIALSSQRPAGGHSVIPFFLGASLAVAVIALMVWFFYRASDRVLSLLGVNGARVMSRLMAFLLMCIGVQIVASGVESLATQFLLQH